MEHDPFVHSLPIRKYGNMEIYPLVMTFTVRHDFSMAPIEIDALPMKNGGSFHGYVSHNQMVFIDDFPRTKPP